MSHRGVRWTGHTTTTSETMTPAPESTYSLIRLSCMEESTRMPTSVEIEPHSATRWDWRPRFPSRPGGIGHAAVATTGAGVYSFGGYQPDSGSFSKDLQFETGFTNVVVVVLPTTQQQEQLIHNAMSNSIKQPYFLGLYDCSTSVLDALYGAGVAVAQTLQALSGDAPLSLDAGRVAEHCFPDSGSPDLWDSPRQPNTFGA
jgi:hypothetical protein